MICESCEANEAVIHLTQIEGNEMSEVHLCEVCAAERGLETEVQPTGLPLTNFLAQMSDEGAGPRPGADTRCPFCGLTFGEFREVGRLGCPQCWSAFESHLTGLLRRVHGSTQHIGKVYLPPDPTASEREKRLEGLRRQLERAVDIEDFERAAALRDEIRSFAGSS